MAWGLLLRLLLLLARSRRGRIATIRRMVLTSGQFNFPDVFSTDFVAEVRTAMRERKKEKNRDRFKF